MSMLAHTDVSTLDTVGCTPERDIEVEVLLQAVTTLRREGILTDAECEVKRQRLAARR